ncbi:hypothetical protein [Ureibacillus acetophenoni]|uniref:DUF1211 domain-containing protein n=1 Tax=Ureibacillus acetophenoni TaxID=614649 RepID=A0A285UEN5_9BACL|nr:hypothetical protein [Ureibacillus acetophenoni]SOC39838.1 hypothetical protein SAMN05877842_106145 [Ureibacillus acetophenoni]
MSPIFRKIFWGYILTIFDIRIFIDILIDPIGYYLIYSGIKQLINKFPIGNKSKYVSLALIFYSIPSIFYEDTLNDWDWYYGIFSLMDLILVFYLFQLIIEIAKAANDPSFEKRSLWTGRIYFINIFIIYLFSSFLPNIPLNNSLIFISIIILLSTLVLEIMFLVLLWATRNLYVKLDE